MFFAHVCDTQMGFLGGLQRVQRVQDTVRLNKHQTFFRGQSFFSRLSTQKISKGVKFVVEISRNFSFFNISNPVINMSTLSFLKGSENIQQILRMQKNLKKSKG